MNIVIKQKKYQGSALLVVLMTAWIIGIALVSYLTLVANQNRSTYSSLAWNTCVPVAEAGVEEAFAQIKKHANDNLGANQWALNTSDQRFYRSRQVHTNGSYYEVSIQPTDPRGEPHGPVIYSTGYAPGPASTGLPMGGETAFGMILGSLSSGPRLVSRTVRVTTIREGFAPGGLNTEGRITFSGGAFFDSFDSSNPNYNTGGRYDPAKRSANAKAITNLRATDAMNLGGGTIYGSVATGPDGIVNIGGGSVGDLAWTANSSGIQAGHQKDDANLQFDDVEPPFLYGAGLTPVAGTVDDVPYTWVLPSGNYQLGSVNLSGGKTLYVTGDATLYVNGNFSTSGGGGVIIAPGASLKLYIAGSANFTGNGIVNGSGRSRNLSIYGLKTSTSFSYSGTSAFIGTVNAPNAALSFSGSAGAFGGFIGKTANVSGGGHIAYDEDLRNVGDFILESWNEI
jgi:hypothetical protein